MAKGERTQEQLLKMPCRSRTPSRRETCHWRSGVYWIELYSPLVAEHLSDDVVNYDALTYAGNLENLADIADNAHGRFVKGDIGDYNTARAALDGVDVVVNFASRRTTTDP